MNRLRMARISLQFGRFFPIPIVRPKSSLLCRRNLHTDISTFAEGDRVLVTGVRHANRRIPVLSKPLRPGNEILNVKHESIIGRSARDVVSNSKGIPYRITLPSLEEYVALTPREVTPIYAQDANLIVSLLDIHVFPPDPTGNESKPIEILEAGTGHGSLTLHIARAIHAANSIPPTYPPPRVSRPAVAEESCESNGDASEGSGNDQTPSMAPEQEAYEAWRSKRGAIVHSVEISSRYSKHAESVVRGFRRGMYAGSVDFHVAHVEDWIAQQVRERRGESQTAVDPFLSYAILDMPSAERELLNVAPMLRNDGIVAVFMPNISQIAECEKVACDLKLRLSLEKVVELGTGISGGRLWDVRYTRPRKHESARVAATKTAAEPESDDKISSGEEASEDGTVFVEEMPSRVEGSDENAILVREKSNEKELVLVCRPKVGERIVGGGFVGIWRKMTDTGSTNT